MKELEKELQEARSKVEQNLGEGAWGVVRVIYLGGDITAEATIEVNMVGMRMLPSRLRSVDVYVADLI